jgi:hypothetical protein
VLGVFGGCWIMFCKKSRDVKQTRERAV